MWIAEITPGTEVFGGSILCSRGESLSASAGATLTVVRDGNGDLPHVIVVQEALAGGTFVYHGLAIDGTWIASPPQNQAATGSHHGFQYTLLELGSTQDVIAFTPWELVGNGWDDLSSSAPQTIEANEFLATLSNGTDLVGYSPFAQIGSRPTAAVSNATFSPAGGPVERHHHVWDTGAGSLLFYADNADLWISLATTNPVNLNYGAMTVVADDGATGTFYSGMTGTMTQHVFANPVAGNLTQGGYVDVVFDAAGGEAVIHRAMDNSLHQFPLSGGESTIVQDTYAGLVLGSTYELVSGTVGGPSAVLNLPAGANVVGTESSATVHLIETDEPAVYGYSSMTGGWSQVALPANFNVVGVTAKHSVGYVVLEERDGGGVLIAQQVAAFAPREDVWQLQVLSPAATISSEAGFVTAVDSGTRYAFGTESLAWRSEALPTGTPIASGITADMVYDLVPDGAGGTTLTAYSRITDRFCVGTIPFVITNPATEVFELEQGVLAYDTAGGVVYTYSAFGDLMSQHTWPTTNMPSLFSTGSPPERFLAIGRPSMLNSVVVGVTRDPGIVFPPALGLLQMALVPEPKLSPIGAMDQRGCIGYSLDIPGIVPRGIYYLQSINIDPNAGSSVSWGDYVYPFQIH